MTNGESAKTAVGAREADYVHAADGYEQLRIDPTKNVLDLVEAAIKRIDDLQAEHKRTLDAQFNRIDDIRDTRITCLTDLVRIETTHYKDISTIRSIYEEKLRNKETDRIDAIRAVDVAAVQRAAEVSAAQSQTLANQVQTSAETLRTQVATTAVAQATALAAALEPIQKDISELRKTQYESQGQKIAQIESRATDVQDRGSNQWLIGVVIGIVVLIVNIVLAVLLRM